MENERIVFNKATKPKGELITQLRYYVEHRVADGRLEEVGSLLV